MALGLFQVLEPNEIKFPYFFLHPDRGQLLFCWKCSSDFLRGLLAVLKVLVTRESRGKILFCTK